MGGDAWIADDGTRLFNRFAHVFRLSPNQADDLVYAGRLSGLTDLLWVSDAPQLGRVFAVHRETNAGLSTRLHVYERANLNALPYLTLPTFSNSSGPVAAHGHFVFPLRDRVYVVTQAAGGAGLLQDWGIIAFDRAQIP